MNYYINTLLIISTLFFSCAVQSPPTGGALDDISPYIKFIDPPNGTTNLEKNKSIELGFNEMLNPNTIKSSISIYPDIDFKINSYRNKIISIKSLCDVL